MPSLTTVEVWMLINSAALLLLMAGIGMLWHKQQQHITRLKDTVAQLQQAQSVLTNSTVGMGQRLTKLNGQVQHSQPASLNNDAELLAQATRLVKLGASANDIVDSCGVPRGEAELLISMQRMH